MTKYDELLGGQRGAEWVGYRQMDEEPPDEGYWVTVSGLDTVGRSFPTLAEAVTEAEARVSALAGKSRLVQVWDWADPHEQPEVERVRFQRFLMGEL